MTQSQYITKKELALKVGVSTKQITSWTMAGVIAPASTEDGRPLFLAAEIMRLRTLAGKDDDPDLDAMDDVEPIAFDDDPQDMCPDDDAPSGPVVEPPADIESRLFSHFNARLVGNHVYPPAAQPRELLAGETRLIVKNYFGGGVDIVSDNTAYGWGTIPGLDPKYVLTTREYLAILNALVNNEPTLIWGPSGSGKTSGVRQVSAMLNWPLERVNMDGDVSVADFVGDTNVVIDPVTKQAVTEFIPGALIRAGMNGSVLMIDEITATPPHILIALQAVLERDETGHGIRYNCTIDGRLYHFHPRFRIIATDNTNGQGDLTGAHAGTTVMNEATRRRFTQWLHKNYLSKDKWIDMLMSRTGIGRDTAEKIVTIAESVNVGSSIMPPPLDEKGAPKNRTITNSMFISPPHTMAIARHSRSFGLMNAFRLALVNSMIPGEADTVFFLDTLRNMIGLGA